MQPFRSQPVPIIESGQSLQPGDMEPTAFICKGCTERMQESKFGAGFKDCGAVLSDRKYYLCPRCLSIVMDLIEAFKSREGLIAFAEELKVCQWP